MNSKDLYTRLLRVFDIVEGRGAATLLHKISGISYPVINYWSTGNGSLTERTLSSAIRAAWSGGRDCIAKYGIRPVIEHYPLDCAESRSGNYFELLDTSEKDSYNYEIRKYLEKCKGIYVFYDSNWEVIYIGKTSGVGQNLWIRMNQTYNEEKSQLKIYRVAHSYRKDRFRPAWQKPREIVHEKERIFSIAEYFSAYEVSPPLINCVEALLIRVFANSLTNKRMERFASFDRVPAQVDQLLYDKPFGK